MKGGIRVGAIEALEYIKKREDVEPYLKFCAYLSASNGNPRTYGDKQQAIEWQRQLFKSLLTLGSKFQNCTCDYDAGFFDPFLAILFDADETKYPSPLSMVKQNQEIRNVT